MGPKNLTKYFTHKKEKSDYNLRNISNAVCLPQPRTNYMKKSFLYDGASIWNSLPMEIRESKTLTCFKNKIDNHILE